MAKILLLEDDEELAVTLQTYLKGQGYTVEVVSEGKEACDRLNLYDYDLAILDWEVPQLSGVEVCKRYRAQGGLIPVLFLTGKKSLPSKTAGFESGADDYLTKPFEIDELALRVRALLRRQPVFVPDILEIGDLAIDRKKHTVTVKGSETALKPKEFALLELLAGHPGETYSAEALLNLIWPADSEATADTIRTHIKTLRKKIESDDRRLIRNIYGLGYRFEK